MRKKHGLMAAVQMPDCPNCGETFPEGQEIMLRVWRNGCPKCKYNFQTKSMPEKAKAAERNDE